MKRRNTAYLTYSALMTALAIILTYFFEIPMSFFAPWLKLDFSFVPTLLLGFSLGPIASLMTLVVTNLVHLLSTTTGGVGQLANIIVGVCFLMPPAIMYRRNRNIKSAVVGMVIGIVLMTVMAVVVNRYILVPALLGDKAASFDMVKYLMSAIIPFNLIKGTINAGITFVLYKHLSRLLKKMSDDCA